MEIGRNHFYVTLFSNASQSIFPKNKLTSLKSHLAQPVNLGTSSNWEIGICEFTCQPPKPRPLPATAFDIVGEANVLIYCDLIAPQFVGKNYIRLLRTFIRPSKFCEHLFQNIYYLPVEKSVFQEIHIEMRKLDGNLVDYKDSNVPIKIVLHFRRV
jgi:hypothetical protein